MMTTYNVSILLSPAKHVSFNTHLIERELKKDQYISHIYNVDICYYSKICVFKINPSAAGYAISWKCNKKTQGNESEPHQQSIFNNSVLTIVLGSDTAGLQRALKVKNAKYYFYE